VPLRALKQELVSLEAQQLALQQELATRDAPAPLMHPNLAEVYRQQVERLHEALQEPATHDEIQLIPEDGKLRVELHGLIVQEVSELGVVSQELWDAVKDRQRSLKRNTRPDLAKKPFWARQRPRFLITGLAKCSGCGSSYVKHSRAS
jgi:hypothetical protein